MIHNKTPRISRFKTPATGTFIILGTKQYVPFLNCYVIISNVVALPGVKIDCVAALFDLA